MSPEEKKGTLAGLACYVLWGLFPLYWKLLGEVNSFEIICHRIIWCTLFTAITCAVMKTHFLTFFKDARARKILIPAAILITVNWSVYIYAVNIGHVVETAIGYYINPLVSILMGVAFFKEKLTRIQTVAVVLCCIGVVFFTVNYGHFPWISVVLALSFGFYGALKKKGGYPAIPALAVENVTMLVPAIVAAFAIAGITGSHGFLGDMSTPHGWGITALLVVGGLVTAVPLVLFAVAANKIPLSLLGFIQYVSPTLALLCGVFILGEDFTLAHGVCLGCIWLGLIMVSGETLAKARKPQA